MSAGPQVAAHGIGREGQPLIVIDDFAADPDALRAAAAAAQFEPARHHYPGIRAPLPDHYLRDQLPVIARQVRAIFGRHGAIEVIDASFSIVTVPPPALSPMQRLPHFDSFAPERIALIHYLSHDPAGTAFFRHRATGFETITDARAPRYFAEVDAEMRAPDTAAAGYIAGDTGLFERTMLARARYNRALIYPSFLLHSGAIVADTALSPDPLHGRLTVTAFLSVAN